MLRRAGRIRVLGCFSILAMVAGCATGPSPIRTVQEAPRDPYTPPGPPSDPWGPYIVEASQHYQVPEGWIREVMRAESNGAVMETSRSGAMGLMQLMPQTYKELRSRYGLGDDPYNPHDNVTAGTAYLREMYTLYGFPHFLAAYNAGPGRLSDCLQHNRPLPDDTRRYMARIEPRIADIKPTPPGPRDVHWQAVADDSHGHGAPEKAMLIASVAARASPMWASRILLDAPPRDMVGPITAAMAEPPGR